MYLEELMEAIKEDLLRDKSYDRYPVRFFGMNLSSNSANELLELKNNLNSVNEYHVEIIDIQNYLPHENGWINIDRFRNIIYGLEKNKSYIVVGFSEYARFLSKEVFFTILISLLELENDGIHVKRRIYFPCFSLYNQIKSFVAKHHRRKEVYNPLLTKMEIEELPKMFFVDQSLDGIDFENEVQTSTEWFSIWRNSRMDISKPIICTSKTLCQFYDVASPDNVYNIKRITSYKDILALIYNIHGIIEYQPETNEYMKRLIKLLQDNKGQSFSNIILKEINTQVLNQDNIYALWSNVNKFKRWLIQNYFLLFEKRDSYLREVLSQVRFLSLDEFKENIFEYLGDFNDENRLLERRKLIDEIKKIDTNIALTGRVIAYYEKILRDIIKKQTAIAIENVNFNQDCDFSADQLTKIAAGVEHILLPLITNSSTYERRMIIWLYRFGLLNKNQMKYIYPELYDYLFAMEEFVTDDDEARQVEAYFSAYRRCRSLKLCEDNYDNILKPWNENEERFYTWYTNEKLRYPETIIKESGFQGSVYVIDGVSAEFMGYLVALLKRVKLNVQHMEYAKSHLPTITSVARNYYDDSYKWVVDYDRNVIHGKVYYHVSNLESALTYLKNIVNTIINEVGERAFAIIADHGSTVGHKISKKGKKYDFKTADHDGRCCRLKDNEWANSADDYTIYTSPSGEKWIMPLTSQSLCNSSKYEVHGGATPEEVIIPVIIVERAIISSVNYKVTPEKLNVSGLDKMISVKVRPMPQGVRVIAKDGTNCEMRYDKNKKEWIAALRRGIAQEINIVIDDKKFAFRTIPSTKMGGNDGFDD